MNTGSLLVNGVLNTNKVQKNCVPADPPGHNFRIPILRSLYMLYTIGVCMLNFQTLPGAWKT